MRSSWRSRTTGPTGTWAVWRSTTRAPRRAARSRSRTCARCCASACTCSRPFRWRLVEVPFSLDHPFWVEQADVDLEYHVREIALPAPGNLRQLAEQGARIFERRLDRSRPLWEMYLIHGVENGTKVGLLTKVHHAALDGLSGAEILVTLMDLAPTGRVIAPPEPGRPADPAPSRFELLARGLTATPRHSARALRSLPTTLPNLDLVPTLRSVPGVNVVSGAARRVGELLPGRRQRPRRRAPDRAEDEPQPAHLRAPALRLHDDLARATSSASRTTSASPSTTSSSRSPPARCASGCSCTTSCPTDPLLAMVPVSVRLPEEFGTFGNRVSMMTVPIPTNEHEPAQRVRPGARGDGRRRRRGTTRRRGC